MYESVYRRNYPQAVLPIEPAKAGERELKIHPTCSHLSLTSPPLLIPFVSLYLQIYYISQTS